MSSATSHNPDSRAIQPDVYTHGYSSGVTQDFARRTVAEYAGFFLPHLRSGMKLLDCGCGPGTVTIGWGFLHNPLEKVHFRNYSGYHWACGQTITAISARIPR